jgi:hypothetical protein
MKLKPEWRIPASVAITLLHLTAHSAANAQTTQPASSTTVVKATQATPTPDSTAKDAITTQAATAARQDTDPKLNGSISDVAAKPSSK